MAKKNARGLKKMALYLKLSSLLEIINNFVPRTNDDKHEGQTYRTQNRLQIEGHVDHMTENNLHRNTPPLNKYTNTHGRNKMQETQNILG